MHEHYKEALFEKKEMWHGMNNLRARKHEICGEYVNKKSLPPFDTKRWIDDDGIHTNAYGYNPLDFTELEGLSLDDFGFLENIL